MTMLAVSGSEEPKLRSCIASSMDVLKSSLKASPSGSCGLAALKMLGICSHCGATFIEFPKIALSCDDRPDTRRRRSTDPTSPNSLQLFTMRITPRLGAGAGAGSHSHGGHPIHVHPPRPLYRFCAIALPASMWFFVCIAHTCNDEARAKLYEQGLTCMAAVLSNEEGWTGVVGLEAPLGSLKRTWISSLRRFGRLMHVSDTTNMRQKAVQLTSLGWRATRSIDPLNYKLQSRACKDRIW